MTHETPEPTAQWDKVFPQSDAVDHEKVAFRTRFGIGKRVDVKRAIVTVAEGDRIDIFAGQGE